MENKILTWGNTDFEIHPKRAEQLLAQDIIEAVDADNYRVHPGLGEGQKELVEALLDLCGEWL